MTPEPTPEPEPTTAPAPAAPPAVPTPAPPPPTPPPEPPRAPDPAPTPQWVAVPTDPAAAPVVPAETTADQAIQQATTRRGTPWLVVLGTLVALLGITAMLYTFYLGQGRSSLPRPGGIRGDYIGVILLLIGIAIVGTFLFVPPRRNFGLAVNATRDDIEQEIRSSKAKLRMAQTWVGLGMALVSIGLFWMLYWTFVAYLENGFRNSIVSRYEVPTHYFGAVVALVGLLFALYFLGSVGGARRRHNLATVLLHRAPATPATAAPNLLSVGVSETEVQNLMRRLDGLMAQLPDAAVTEFSKTPEADTYLKLLGS